MKLKWLFTLLPITALAGGGLVQGPIIGPGSGGSGSSGGGTILTNGSSNTSISGTFAGALGNYIVANQIQRLLVMDNSESVSGTPTGWYSYGGLTNPLASFRQQDGTLFYTNNSNFSFSFIGVWPQFTNDLFQGRGYVCQLDTAMAVPGDSLENVVAGSYSYNNTIEDQNYSGTYPASGIFTNIIGGQQWITVWPFSNSVTAFSITNFGTGTFTTFPLTVGIPLSVYITGNPAAVGRQIYYPFAFSGTPTKDVRASVRVSVQWFAGQGTKAQPPYFSGGGPNSGSNNLPPINWLVSNSPAITGLRTAVIMYDDVHNDIGSGFVSSSVYTNVFPFVTNQITALWTNNELPAINLARSLGIKVIGVAGFNSLSYQAFNPIQSTIWHSYNTNVATNYDAYFDAWTYYGTNLTGASLPDGTHPNTTFSGSFANILATGIPTLVPFNAIPWVLTTNIIAVNTVFTNPFSGKSTLIINVQTTNSALVTTSQFIVTNWSSGYNVNFTKVGAIADIDQKQIMVPISGGDIIMETNIQNTSVLSSYIIQ